MIMRRPFPALPQKSRSMTRIAVVAYPTLDQRALDWIESIRGRHDPQAGRIPPHFTLIFPVDVSPDDIRDEVARAALRYRPVPFVIRTAISMPDVVQGGAHVFVVPEEGHDQIARLHDELYAGVLRPHLREDIAFVPHITIATGNTRWCETYALQLNGTLQPVHGVIESVTILDVTRTEIESLARFALGTPSSQPA
jgi:2'-5' RNA ligase